MQMLPGSSCVTLLKAYREELLALTQIASRVTNLVILCDGPGLSGVGRCNVFSHSLGDTIVHNVFTEFNTY